jgi:hypothetical protein
VPKKIDTKEIARRAMEREKKRRSKGENPRKAGSFPKHEPSNVRPTIYDDEDEKHEAVLPTFKRFFNESYAISPIRDVDMWDQATSDWWGFIERATDGIGKPLTKHIVNHIKSHFVIAGPDQQLEFYSANSLDMKTGQQKGSDKVIMIIRRIGGYPDSGYVITDIDITLVKNWWRDWIEDNEGHYTDDKI